MNKNKYVGKIVKKIKCGGTKKKDIRKQLMADVDMRLEQGQSMNEIMTQMGTVEEIAASFNENIAEGEQKSYSRKKILKIIAGVIVVAAVLMGSVYYMLPKSHSIEESKFFDKEQVEASLKEVVELLDANDYDTFASLSSDLLNASLTPQIIEDAKSNIMDNWGERIQYGAVYMAEVEQNGVYSAVGEIAVVYENVSVIYRISFDEDMKVNGLYMR